MPLNRPADPGARAEPFLDALSRVCDHYDLAVESDFVRLSGPADRVHYLTAGEGPPVVLLHGLGTTASSWLPLFDALTDRFTVYAPDRPGRGLSTPVDYRETGFREFGVEYVVGLLDELGVREPAVVGNSLGGFQGIALAVDYAERVERLCLMGAPVGLSRSLPPLFRLFDVPVFGDWLFDFAKADTVADVRETYRQMNVADDSALPTVYFEPEVVAEELPGRRESLRSLMAELGTARGMAPEFDLREELPSVETPTRFVWGTEDAFWKPEDGRRWVERMPNAELTVLPGCGHTPWLEPGDAATDAAVEFLAGA